MSLGWQIYLFLFAISIILERLYPAVHSKQNIRSRATSVFIFLLMTILVGDIVLRLIFLSGTFSLKPREFSIWFVLLCIAASDFIHYFVHRALHTFDFLWPIHRLHHSDQTIDAFTSMVMHPLDAISHRLVRWVIFYLASIDFTVWIIVDVVISVFLLLIHVNVRLPDWAEKILQPVFMLPSTHRIHHDCRHNENIENSVNYGLIFSFWDILFKTFVPEKNTRTVREFGIPSLPAPNTRNLLKWVMFKL